ncbi:dihydropteroate synthase [Rhodococcus sp. LB1]|uniref:dihydropteroate synthase n=1 Tax=Rhodococcus sp. LB1 TaxID=1807499 RepID=UPI00077A076A|nr:dihydropteroate synthase [Rhodococcus sp. LB1]KXX58244.1 dihydropteroate synthase [Rhodococcus sp. LB1]
MGILNVTPDSFSDGGVADTPSLAIRKGVLLASYGADIVDVGGESTRPNAQRVTAVEEMRRVIPVIAALASEGITVSVDTMRADVARAAVHAGATIVNDVSGGLADPAMASAVAGLGVPYVAMHWRGHSRAMNTFAVYDDVVADVVTELEHRVEALVEAGISEHRLVLDPGLGFAKTAEHNWALLSHLDRILALGRPVLVGASRKSFLGSVVARIEAEIPAPRDRDDLTGAVTALAAAAGARCIRVHDARSTRRAVAVAHAWTTARHPA